MYNFAHDAKLQLGQQNARGWSLDLFSNEFMSARSPFVLMLPAHDSDLQLDSTSSSKKEGTIDTAIEELERGTSQPEAIVNSRILNECLKHDISVVNRRMLHSSLSTLSKTPSLPKMIRVEIGQCLVFLDSFEDGPFVLVDADELHSMEDASQSTQTASKLNDAKQMAEERLKKAEKEKEKLSDEMKKIVKELEETREEKEKSEREKREMTEKIERMRMMLRTEWKGTESLQTVDRTAHRLTPTTLTQIIKLDEGNDWRTAFTFPIDEGEWELKIRGNDPLWNVTLGFLKHPLPDNATHADCSAYDGGIGGDFLLYSGEMWKTGIEIKPTGTNTRDTQVGQTAAIRVNMRKREARLFVDDEEQPKIFTGIPSPLCLAISTHNQNQPIEVLHLLRTDTIRQTKQKTLHSDLQKSLNKHLKIDNKINTTIEELERGVSQPEEIVNSGVWQNIPNLLRDDDLLEEKNIPKMEKLIQSIVHVLNECSKNDISLVNRRMLHSSLSNLATSSTPDKTIRDGVDRCLASLDSVKDGPSMLVDANEFKSMEDAVLDHTQTSSNQKEEIGQLSNTIATLQRQLKDDEEKLRKEREERKEAEAKLERAKEREHATEIAIRGAETRIEQLLIELQKVETNLKESEDREMKLGEQSLTDIVQYPDGYSFVRIINSGGFGTVVELIEKSTNIHYAGKIVPCMTQKHKDRFDREVGRLKTFSHPRIIKLKEVITMDNAKVMVMELGGISLADVVHDYTSRNIQMPRDEVYRVMEDITSALDHIHNHTDGRISHGDIKMENILMDEDGHVKLCGFGETYSEDVNLTEFEMPPLYVSPERLNSESGAATCEGDVWALGVVLYRLLFGEPPFKSLKVVQMIKEITSFKATQIPNSCGEAERELLMRMMDPSAETRLTSRQLSRGKTFRCIVNSAEGIWKLMDAEQKEQSEREKEKLSDELKRTLTDLKEVREKMEKSGRSYTVQTGDTLNAIAARLGTSVAALMERNGMKEPNMIYPGQVLYYKP
ncbi:putative Carbon catabolite-derepressing protein kinase [Blattamonas nauphoetae]|uniref:Carbon catabolite-derepressing protein kinase n=1 Tax=Blattamonas nauphoetae TaxID=2049346 RepID=A0ABQ9YBE1_9EUKA|nr:putative Carbon catabolite-derepressing protein kinase [Blattamonas nauphoetae]